MTLPETTPPPPPVLGYAGAEAIQLDLRALARIRLGIGFLIVYLVSSLVRMIVPSGTYTVQSVIAVTFALCLAGGACQLAANTRLLSDRPVLRHLLFFAAFPLAVVVIAQAAAMYAVFSNGTSPKVSNIWLLNFTYVSSSIAHGTVLCLCFSRLANLSRWFHARAIAIQCLVVAVIFLALYAFYLTYGLVAAVFGVNTIRTLSFVVAIFRTAISLWAATFLAFLFPRLKTSPA